MKICSLKFFVFQFHWPNHYSSMFIQCTGELHFSDRHNLDDHRKFYWNKSFYFIVMSIHSTQTLRFRDSVGPKSEFIVYLLTKNFKSNIIYVSWKLFIKKGPNQLSLVWFYITSSFLKCRIYEFMHIVVYLFNLYLKSN